MLNRSVRDIMSTHLVMINADASILDCARRMRDEDIGWLPVVDQDDNIIGTITDRDIVIRGLTLGQTIGDLKCRDVMTPDVYTVLQDDSVEAASGIMRKRRVRRLLVLDDQDQAVGVLSLGDFTEVPGSEVPGETLKSLTKEDPTH